MSYDKTKPSVSMSSTSTPIAGTVATPTTPVSQQQKDKSNVNREPLSAQELQTLIEEKFDFLPQMHRILSLCTQETTDAGGDTGGSTSGGEEHQKMSRDVNTSVMRLFRSFQQAQDIVDDLEGTELTGEQQRVLYRQHEQTLVQQKSKLVQKYRDLEIFTQTANEPT